MKTAVTIITTEQISMDEWKDLRHTNVFDDSATLFDIKQWIKLKSKSTLTVSEISLGVPIFSDVDDAKPNP